MQPNPSAVGADGNDSLVLERMPNGEMAWLRPVQPGPLTRYRLTDRVVIEDEPRYTITDAGRVAIVEHEREDAARAAAIALLFGTTPGARSFACACSASGSGDSCGFVINSARRLQEHYRDVHHWTVSLCPACGKPQDAPSCDDREHWGVS
jgi:hypothetical protein